MLLTEVEVEQARSRVVAAFPHFTRWAYANKTDDYHGGFCIWGEYSPPAASRSTPRFFVTFSISGAGWQGHLSVGKHCYYWSSTEVGDAHLLDTKPSATLEEAIATLARQIRDLFVALRGPGD